MFRMPGSYAKLSATLDDETIAGARSALAALLEETGGTETTPDTGVRRSVATSDHPTPHWEMQPGRPKVEKTERQIGRQGEGCAHGIQQCAHIGQAACLNVFRASSLLRYASHFFIAARFSGI